MRELWLECAVRSTLIAAVVGAILCAMRIRPAAARHAAWTGVMLVMLILPLWEGWGPKASVELLPGGIARVEETSAGGATPITTNDGLTMKSVSSRRSSAWNWTQIAGVIYL